MDCRNSFSNSDSLSDKDRKELFMALDFIE